MFLYIYIYIHDITDPHMTYPFSAKKKNKKIHILWVTDPWGPRQWATPQQNKHTHSQPKKKPILWSLSHRPTTNMSRAEGPKAPKPKTKKQRVGKAKRERKKKRNPLGDSDFRFRAEASERRGRESESLRDVPAARRRRRSSCRGSVCDGNVRAEWRLWEWATEYYIFLLLLNSFVFQTC